MEIRKSIATVRIKCFPLIKFIFWDQGQQPEKRLTLTILTGLRSSCCLLWLARKGARSSTNSISTSSSNQRERTPFVFCVQNVEDVGDARPPNTTFQWMLSWEIEINNKFWCWKSPRDNAFTDSARRTPWNWFLVTKKTQIYTYRSHPLLLAAIPFPRQNSEVQICQWHSRPSFACIPTSQVKKSSETSSCKRQ